MPTVSVDQFRGISTKLFKAAGASDEEARIVTESLLFASLRGHDSHGVGHLPLYINNYLGGGPTGSVSKDAPLTIVQETPATVAIDANWGLGQRAAMKATEIVIEKAKNTGIAAATLYRNTHTGSLGYYTSKIAEHDMIGIMFTCSGAASPPHGGVERIFGTNPISFAIPAKNEYPIVIDMATSSTTWMWLLPKIAMGEPIPEGLVLDDGGEPTVNPQAFTPPGREVHGSMTNMGGGPKGYAMQVAVEMLGGILPALMTGTEAMLAGRLHTPALIIAINVSFFQDVEAFKEKVDGRIREIRASKKKKNVDAIYLPGERGLRTQEKRLKEGLPIIDHYWKEIVKLAEELKVELPALTGAAA